jgi:hypothetical protein
MMNIYFGRKNVILEKLRIFYKFRNLQSIGKKFLGIFEDEYMCGHLSEKTFKCLEKIIYHFSCYLYV